MGPDAMGGVIYLIPEKFADAKKNRGRSANLKFNYSMTPYLKD